MRRYRYYQPVWLATPPMAADHSLTWKQEDRDMLENQVQGDIGGFWAWVILAVIVFGAVVAWRKRKDKK